MKYSIDKKDSYLILTIKEEKIDSMIAPELKSELIKLNTNGEQYIVLDLSQVNYIDSSGLSSILVGKRLCGNAGGKMILSNINPHVDKLLEISQLKTILDIVPNIDEAVQFVRLSELENELKKEEK